MLIKYCFTTIVDLDVWANINIGVLNGLKIYKNTSATPTVHYNCIINNIWYLYK